jgi:hypothetical protein
LATFPSSGIFLFEPQSEKNVRKAHIFSVSQTKYEQPLSAGLRQAENIYADIHDLVY